jgi:outer membrane receptor protein involved in Fe transport
MFALRLGITAAFCFLLPVVGAAATSGTTIEGRILDAQGGLPVTGAMVELDRVATKVDSTKADANGNFSFENEPPGTYSFLIVAGGYVTSRAPNLVVTSGEAAVSFQTAIFREPAGMRTIAYVATAGRTALQTTTTINSHVDAGILQSENFQRLGDALTTVPGVVTCTSSSAGDDMSLSIRGFDATETATLLDGHPIGPIGAFGNGYNYNVSPFWGLSGADVIFGSGASGLFGATTIAGAIDFQTIEPTQRPHFSITQGIGSDNKLMTGLLATGTIENVSYAFAWGTQGTSGNFPGAYITQRANLQASVVNSGASPDLTRANVDNFLNTYWVSGNYSQKNFVGKLRYSLTPTTQLQLTAYSANDWSNSTGEGDNDFQTYPYVLYGAIQTIKSGPTSVDVNGVTETCTNSIAVLVNAAPGYTCMNAKQYAQAFYGPAGGSIDRWRTLGNQDYDARLTQDLGIGQLTIEGFADAYNYDAEKGPGVAPGSYGPGPDYLNLYHNRGFAASYDLPLSKNDVGYGYTWLHQSNTNGQFPYTLANGTQILAFGNNPPLYLATASYFVRDTWTPNDKLQAFGTFWIQRSLDTSSTHIDPRVSLVYRPDPSDVVRVTSGRSYSEPDLSLLAFVPPVYGAPSSINCPASTAGPGAITAIASVADPKLQAETADDLELAYGHRFGFGTNIQADVYQSWENGALLGGLLPITRFPGITVPSSYITDALTRLSRCSGLNPTINDLAFSTTYNAAAARYRGFNVSANVALTRSLTFTAEDAITSATYLGIPQPILYDNIGLIDGRQIYGIPLRSANAGLSYQSAGGLDAEIDTTYVGSYNSWNRGPFWFADGRISQAINSRVTVNVGVQNIFNSAAQQYGLVGLGIFQPLNFYGSAAQGGPTSALQESQEEYGLLPRRIWFTLHVGV